LYIFISVLDPTIPSSSPQASGWSSNWASFYIN